jgi:hypothetical protein
VRAGHCSAAAGPANHAAAPTHAIAKNLIASSLIDYCRNRGAPRFTGRRNFA